MKSISSERFHWLDWVRFLSALMVLFVHARGLVFEEYGRLATESKTFWVAAGFAITRLGNEAVIVFFVLSGFLVGGMSAKRIFRGTFHPASYAIDRSVRIFLPLLPAMLLSGSLAYGFDHSFSLSELLGNLLFLQWVFVKPFAGNAPLWSLAYEAWFYLLVFALGALAVGWVWKRTLTAILVAFALVFTSLSPVYLFCWLSGSVAYLLRPSGPSHINLLFSLIVIAYAICGVQVHFQSSSLALDNAQMFFPSAQASRLLLAVGVAIFIQHIVVFVPSKPSLSRLDFAGTWLASFSYTLYLTHYTVLGAYKHFGLPRAIVINFSSVLVFIGVVVSCLLIAWLMYLAFEAQTDRVKRALKSRFLLGSAHTEALLQCDLRDE